MGLHCVAAGVEIHALQTAIVDRVSFCGPEADRTLLMGSTIHRDDVASNARGRGKQQRKRLRKPHVSAVLEAGDIRKDVVVKLNRRRLRASHRRSEPAVVVGPKVVLPAIVVDPVVRNHHRRFCAWCTYLKVQAFE